MCLRPTRRTVEGMADVTQRPAPSAPELRKDVWLAIALFVAGIISSALMSVVSFYGDGTVGIEWALLTSAVGCLSLALRRRYPIPVAFIVCATYYAAVTFQVPEIHVGNVAMFIALYTVGAWVNNRPVAMWSRVILIAMMMVWLLVTMYFSATSGVDDGLSRAGAFSPYVAYMLLNLLINIAFFCGAYYMGDRAYRSAIEKQALVNRTEELEAERELTAAQAVALDRISIARELHDVVAHHVSAMGVQAAAARLSLDKNPAAAASALGEIEKSARGAIDELHLLLETLRSPGDAPTTVGAASTLRLEHINELTERANDVGMPTSFTVVGDPLEVPDIVHINFYRIAQEAITNARRHGGPAATADVRLRYDPKFVELEVSNTGRTPLGSRAGLGQLGMRERAKASGGSIELTPRSRGGFLVRATVPLEKVTA